MQHVVAGAILQVLGSRYTWYPVSSLVTVKAHNPSFPCIRYSTVPFVKSSEFVVGFDLNFLICLNWKAHLVRYKVPPVLQKTIKYYIDFHQILKSVIPFLL